jgi:hypothetical protein
MWLLFGLVIVVAFWLLARIGNKPKASPKPAEEPRLPVSRDVSPARPPSDRVSSPAEVPRRPVSAVDDTPKRIKPAYAIDQSRPVTDRTFDISYVDADHIPSTRRIEVNGFSDFEHKTYVEAWCHLRRDQRSFRADRIEEMVSASSGEIIERPRDYVRTMREVLYEPGKDYASIMAKARPGLMALIWIARSDNDLSEAEIELMLSFVEERDSLKRKRKDAADWNRTVMRRAIDNARPTLVMATGALAGMDAAGTEKRLIGRYAAQIAAVEESAAKRARKLGLLNLDI